MRSVDTISYLIYQTLPTISFTNADFCPNDPDHDDFMVLTTTIENWRLFKNIIDQSNSADVLHWFTFLKMYIPHTMVKAYPEPLLEFAGEYVLTRGYIDLLTTFGTKEARHTLIVRYFLLEANTSYNMLIRRHTPN